MPCPSLAPFQQIDEVKVITGEVNLDLLAEVVTATFSTAQLLCITLLKSLCCWMYYHMCLLLLNCLHCMDKQKSHLVDTLMHVWSASGS